MGEPKAGLGATSVGTIDSMRLGRDGETLVNQVLPKYAEAARNGFLFHAVNAAAGVAPGTALGTAPPLSLYNPATSTVTLVLTRASMTYISGTLGAGSVVLAQNATQAAVTPTGGTTLTALNARVGGAASQAVAQTGSTISATAVIRQPLFNLTAMLASSANQVATCFYDFDGEHFVPPGTLVCLQGIAAAGTSPLVAFGLSWIEYPITTYP